MRYFIYYLIIINIAAFIITFADKRKAVKNKYRISEKALFVLSVIGGSMGAFTAMLLFRHKTKKWYFIYGIPFIIIIQIIIVCYIYINYL